MCTSFFPFGITNGKVHNLSNNRKLRKPYNSCSCSEAMATHTAPVDTPKAAAKHAMNPTPIVAMAHPITTPIAALQTLPANKHSHNP